MGKPKKLEKLEKLLSQEKLGCLVPFSGEVLLRKQFFQFFKFFQFFFSGKTEKTGKTAFSQTRYIHPNFS